MKTKEMSSNYSNLLHNYKTYRNNLKLNFAAKNDYLQNQNYIKNCGQP